MGFWHCPRCHEPIWERSPVRCHSCGTFLRVIVLVTALGSLAMALHPVDQPHTHFQETAYPDYLHNTGSIGVATSTAFTYSPGPPHIKPL